MAVWSEVELSSSQATPTMSIWRGFKNYNTSMEHLSFQENENIEEPIVEESNKEWAKLIQQERL